MDLISLELGWGVRGESHQFYSIKPTKKTPFLVCLYVKKIKIGKKHDTPLFKTDIFPKKNDGWKMKRPFQKGPPKEGHVNFRGGIPLQMKETEPLAGANRGNGVHHQQISLCWQIEGDHRFQKKKHDDQLDGVSMEFVVPDLKLKNADVVGFGVPLMSFIFFVKSQVVVFILVGGRPHSFSELQTVKNCLRLQFKFCWLNWEVGEPSGFAINDSRIQKETC